MSKVFAVIMAGGSGTRFWPLSRTARPKQFLPLATKKPLIAETLARLKGVTTVKRTLVVCGARHAKPVQQALPTLPKANIVIEPAARNTAPAIALATARVAHLDPDGVVVVVPSDQHVADVAAFTKALDEAVVLARTGVIVTLGITPTRAETGYGYIRRGAPLDSPTARAVAAFVEKPDRATAEQYLASNEYLWNAGIFVFQAKAMLAALATHLPEAVAPLRAIEASLAGSAKKAAAVLAREWPKLPAISIDYAVAEKAKNIAVVPCDCGWSDVGSFNALSEVQPLDAAGNVVRGEHSLAIDSTGCVVLGNGQRVLAVVGMTDVVVVDAGDAVLVLPKDKSQDVRKVVEALKARRLTDTL